MNILLVREENQCVWCGCEVRKANDYPPELATKDHILPRRTGRYYHSRSNLLLSCLRCNRARGEKSIHDWILMNHQTAGFLDRVDAKLRQVMTSKNNFDFNVCCYAPVEQSKMYRQNFSQLDRHLLTAMKLISKLKTRNYMTTGA